MNYNELSDTAKERAFRDFQNRDMYDSIYAYWVFDDWVERLEDVGITTSPDQMIYSGFHSQGDGASFEGSINLKKFLEAHPDVRQKHIELYISTIPFDMLSDDYAEYYGVNLTRFGGSHYSHEYTVHIGSWELDCAFEKREYFEGLMMQAEPDILEQCREHMRSLYNDLQNAYEHEIGLDSFLEGVEYQDFNEDGSLS